MSAACKRPCVHACTCAPVLSKCKQDVETSTVKVDTVDAPPLGQVPSIILPCMCVHMCMPACMSVHACMHVCTCMHVCVRACAHVGAHACMLVCASVHARCAHSCVLYRDLEQLSHPIQCQRRAVCCQLAPETPKSIHATCNRHVCIHHIHTCRAHVHTVPLRCTPRPSKHVRTRAHALTRTHMHARTDACMWGTGDGYGHGYRHMQPQTRTCRRIQMYMLICARTHARTHTCTQAYTAPVVFLQVMDHYISLVFGRQTPSGSCVCEPVDRKPGKHDGP